MAKPFHKLSRAELITLKNLLFRVGRNAIRTEDELSEVDPHDRYIANHVNILRTWVFKQIDLMPRQRGELDDVYDIESDVNMFDSYMLKTGPSEFK